MGWKAEGNISLIEEETTGIKTQAGEEVFTNQQAPIQTISNATHYVTIIFVNDLYQDADDLNAEKMQAFAREGGAFDFLKDPEEKTYSKSDGEPL